MLFSFGGNQNPAMRLFTQQQLALQEAGDCASISTWASFLSYVGAMAGSLEIDKEAFLANLQTARKSTSKQSHPRFPWSTVG